MTQTSPALSLLTSALEQLPEAVLVCRPCPPTDLPGGPVPAPPAMEPGSPTGDGLAPGLDHRTPARTGPADYEVVWANACARSAHDPDPAGTDLDPAGTDLDPAGTVGSRWSRLYPPAALGTALTVAGTVLAGGGPAEGELAVEAGAAARPGHYHYHAARLADGSLLWVLRDMSDRHQVTADLADRERRLRRALIKLQGLQDITAALAGATTMTDVARVVTDITFEVLGVASGGLALLDPRRETLVFRRLTGVSEAFREAWGTIPMSEDNPLSCAVREQRPVYLRDLAQVRERWPSLASTMAGEGRAMLPLTADRPLGGMALVWDHAKEFSDSEQLFLATMAAQCGIALARVQLFEAQATAARHLQRALLPAELPALDGVRTAVRYYTAEGDAVGGDWYDAFALPSGGIGLVIGDVEGHSTAAAAIMGQARNVIRAYSAETNTPAEVLTRANRFLAAHTDVLVTCCYLELRPADRTVTIASAGHPAPVLAEPGGQVRELPIDPGPPLGVLADTGYDEQTVLVAPNSTLTLFTDGLVEQHPGHTHGGLPDLLHTASALADRSPDVMADALADLIGDGPAADDTAVLVVQLTDDPHAGTRHDPARQAATSLPTTTSRVFGPSPAATPAARHYVRDLLHAWGLARLAEAAELLVSELVTNAVVHTAGQVRLSLRRTAGDRVWIGVQDDSERMPRQQSAGGDDVAGRGLAIVALLADRWGVEPCSSGGGKIVWLELCACGPHAA
ncbi:MAG TPA: SpoIIE family protein phosphatase [Kineosporiaceae bacterium]|nr:SpoIIE family protein phosphatase [Kineosporiaceae bacterium]